MLKEEERPNIKHYLKISITNENLQKRLQALNPNQFTDPDGIHQKYSKKQHQKFQNHFKLFLMNLLNKEN